MRLENRLFIVFFSGKKMLAPSACEWFAHRQEDCGASERSLIEIAAGPKLSPELNYSMSFFEPGMCL